MTAGDPSPDVEARSFSDALAALDAAMRFGVNPSLEHMVSLTETLGRPQDAYSCVQVTGTNGKSSTTRMIAALMVAHGRRTGTYTSPELESMTERIEIDGFPVSQGEFARAIFTALAAAGAAKEAGLLPTEESLTQFELLTAGALWLFRERGVQTACLEVGMGGRWDATSVVSPHVSAITGVGIDHAEHLGATRELIAEDKAHIIKQGSEAILGPGTEGAEGPILRRAEACGARVRAVREVGAPSPVDEADTIRFEVTARPHEPGGLTALDVYGVGSEYRGLTLRAPVYQAANAATAIAAAEAALGGALIANLARTAFASITLRGRFELVCAAPPVVIDGAHNPQAARVLAAAIDDAWPEPSPRPALLLGILADKDVRAIVETLIPHAGEIFVTQSGSPRALAAEELGEIVEQTSGRAPRVFDSVASAIGTLLPRVTNGMVVSGSITTAGEARRALRSFC